MKLAIRVMITLLLGHVVTLTAQNIPTPRMGDPINISPRHFKLNTTTTAILAASCAVGDMAFANDGIAGINVYACTATNTWTPQTGYVFVTSDFTTSGVGTALEAITGLTWTFPGTAALNLPFSCHLIYHQNAANAAVAFGTQNATTAPTNYAAKGIIYTSATVFAAANVVANTATSAVSVVSGTPSAITTNWNADLDGFVEQPSGAASVFTIRVSTATAADTVTVKRGSFCKIG